MKIFIFESVGQLTPNYHSGGALIIIAETLEKSLLMAKEYRTKYSFETHDINLTEEEINNVKTFELKKDTEEKIFIFPDSGCC